MKNMKSAARFQLRQRRTTMQLGLLRKDFRRSVDTLKCRRADLLQPASIDAYVELDWLAWHGGSLKLTTVGENIYAQLRLEALELAA